MIKDKLNLRNSSLDIIRIFAAFMVLSVHFFLHNGFYSATVQGTSMYIAVVMRTFFSICVPLFIILTGYLMSGKTLSKKYYKGIVKTLLVFVIATLLCMLFNAYSQYGEGIQNESGNIIDFNFINFIFSTLNFKGANYSWYIEMYIGLFLIAPFLNLAYGKLSSQRHKQVLVFTLVAITILPSLFNIFNFETAQWWTEPTSSDSYAKIFPSWWSGFYPVAYYFTGCYLREYGLKVKTRTLSIVLLLSLIIFGTFNYFRSYGSTFKSGSYLQWNGIESYLIAVFVFTLLSRIKANNAPASVKFVLWKLSDLALGIYLMSYVFDKIVYGTLLKNSYGDRPYYNIILIIAAIVIFAIMAGILICLIKRLIAKKDNISIKAVILEFVAIIAASYLLKEILSLLLKPNTNFTTMADKLPYYLVTVTIIFIFSAIASAVINLAVSLIIKGFNALISFIKKEKAKDNKQKWQHYLFIALMAGSLVFAFWKCIYGFGGNDEAFYLTVPHRLTLGDAFIADEWHLSQLSGFLTMPFVWLYTTIMQTTEGILLTARIVYIVLHAAVTCVIYSRLKQHGYITVFGCVLYFLFTPFNIMAMSYNTMGLDLVALAGVLMGTASYKKKLPVIVSGIAFAGAVLCCPYLAIAYILFALGVVAHIFVKKTRFNKNVFSTDLFAGKTFLWFTIGVAGLAVIFLVFALSRASISEIMTNLPHLLTDPDHPQMSIMTKMSFYFKTIWNSSTHFKYSLICYGVMLLVMIIDRKRRLHRSVYLIITSAIVMISLVMYMPTVAYSTYNHIMYPMIFIGLTSYILTENKQRKLLASLFSLGIIYSIGLCFSSNQYFFVTSMAAAASNIASFVFLSDLIKEMRKTDDNLDYAVFCKYASFSLVALMIILQSGMQITSKATHCFWDSSPNELTYQISCGPAKGIYTNYNTAKTYEDIYNDLKSYNVEDKDRILLLTEKTWTYLALNDFPYGTLSAWITGENQTSISRLEDYYSVNPENKPKYIYIPKNSKWDLTDVYNQAMLKGYNVSENDVSYKLVKVN